MRPPLGLPTIALLAGAASALACQHGIDLQGKVSVPADVQNMFSAQHPGELVIKAEIPGQPDITAPGVILCEPTAGERVIQVKVLKLGCASEDMALVSAWVVARSAEEVRCGAPPPAAPPGGAMQSSALASARAIVSVSKAAAPSNCRDGTIAFALTLAAR